MNLPPPIPSDAMTGNSDRKLSEREVAFCLHIHAGKLQGEAGRLAGFKDGPGLKVHCSRLMKDPAILAYLAELARASGDNPPPPPPPRRQPTEAVVKALLPAIVAQKRADHHAKHATDDPAMDGEVIPPGASRHAEAVADAIVNREWTIALLARNARICMGEIPVAISRVTTGRINAETGAPEIIVTQVETFKHDSTGANQAAALLTKEWDRQDALPIHPGSEAHDERTPALVRNPDLVAALQAFNDRQRHHEEPN
jgi:hypothetical protein